MFTTIDKHRAKKLDKSSQIDEYMRNNVFNWQGMSKSDQQEK